MKHFVMCIALALCCAASADQLKIGLVNCFGGHHHLGPEYDYLEPLKIGSTWTLGREIHNGVHANWRGERSVQWLIDRCDMLIAAGADRILINRPMGHGQGCHTPGTAHLLPAYKWQLLREQFQPWLARQKQLNPNLRVGIHFGATYYDLDTLAGWCGEGIYPGKAKRLRVDTSRGRKDWKTITDPWIAMGVDWFVLDGSSKSAGDPMNRDLVVQIADHERRRGRRVEVWGEAIVSSESHRQQIGWLALLRYMEHPSRPWLHNYVVQPGETLACWISAGIVDETTSEVVADYWARGWSIIGPPSVLQMIPQD